MNKKNRKERALREQTKFFGGRWEWIRKDEVTSYDIASAYPITLVETALIDTKEK